MKKIIYIVLLFCGIYAFQGFSYASTVWGLTGVDVISRKDRGADDSLLFSDLKEYQEMQKNADQYKKYMEELKETDFDKYLTKKKPQIIDSMRDSYLLTNFPSDYSVDSTLNMIDGKNFWWNQSFKKSKTSIVVHHTDNEFAKIKTSADVVSILRSVYRFHAITRGWGDIGYNFVIDPFGNIYEGRSGGEGVIGAHAKRNNNFSVGISLIGNFQVDTPTDKQFDALVKLSTAISKKYDIKPYNIDTYHKEISAEPYIKDFKNYSIAGHRDAGYTSCPGENLYKRLPELRLLVNNNLLGIDNSKLIYNSKTKPVTGIIVNKKYVLTGDKQTVSFKYAMSGFVDKCYTNESTFSVDDCDYKDGNLYFSLSYKKPKASGVQKVYIELFDKIYSFKLDLRWEKDLAYSLDEIKNKYVKDKGFKFSTENFSKISKKIYIKEAKDLMSKNVRVLLYDLSTSYNHWDFNCKSKCNVNIDGKDYYGLSSLGVTGYDLSGNIANSSGLVISMNGKIFAGSSIKVSSKGLIEVSNYDRKGYGGVKWNLFKGSLDIKSDKIKMIGKSESNQFVVVNELPFDDYMLGIAEMNDQQHYEKLKAMALIIKGYILFYISKDNLHPSIPKGSDYNAVDDARIFQKYVGAGYEGSSKLWPKALKDTKDQILLYNGYLPIMPYYSCSAGFTWSGKEKFGWNDTPYLISKVDVFACDDFNGHGVGLSGKGAQYLAEKGIGYKDIIKYYYGIDVTDMKK